MISVQKQLTTINTQVLFNSVTMVPHTKSWFELINLLMTSLYNYRSGICGMSIQRAPSTAHSTPRGTPHPPSVSPMSDDVVRIHVTYNPLSASPSHLQPISPSKMKNYSEVHHKPVSLGFYTTNGSNRPTDNRIRIQVPSEELLTPVVDSGRIINQRYIESHAELYDLK